MKRVHILQVEPGVTRDIAEQLRSYWTERTGEECIILAGGTYGGVIEVAE